MWFIHFVNLSLNNDIGIKVTVLLQSIPIGVSFSAIILNAILTSYILMNFKTLYVRKLLAFYVLISAILGFGWIAFLLKVVDKFLS
ncbi:hypothetical protein AKG60_26190 [Vibrio parahaemolyticus]|uniref:Uncharacterized protein n=1 Tax=Vibrio parahaemolyticus TaxID=670 RepID=A0AAX0M5P7_VIBPH|nr:hypothetical protein [Vibrio parahaemolyticus]EGR3229155.1 hypothetical protein [Vibrio parahaemolyticus]EGR3310156.1 hypothetical protein [Vibrio parahaemolyticus]KOF25750.1 hypothetical protein ACX13_21245 [Vibrio parahaemolyticus]KOY41022.1 hypothetical protein ACX10_03200 [Vibrio parahaemolyticus]